MKVWQTVLVVLAVATLMSAQTKQSTDERDIRNLDKAWLQALAAKDVNKFVSYYAADANVMPFNAPIATTGQQRLAFWKGLVSAPGFGGTFGPTKVEVAKSGDLAYDQGTFEIHENDAKGKPTTTVGKYLVVWKKINGQWKAAVDIFNTDK